MKKKTFLEGFVILMLLLSWFPAHADIINVLSQEYYIYGMLTQEVVYDPATDDWYFPNIVKTYQVTSALPVFLSESNGIASFTAGASGIVKPESANVKSYTGAYCDGYGHSYVSASSSMTFSPLVNYMRVFIWSEILYGNYTLDSHSYALEDLTSGVILFNYYDWGYTLNNIIEFDTSHIYRISTSSSASCPSWQFLESSLNLATIPEPATMLLLSLGLVGLVGIRRKIKK